MKDWWNSLAKREQRLVLWGGIVVVLLIYYFAILSPMQDKISALKKSVANDAALLTWMQKAKSDVKQAEQNRVKNTANRSKSLLTLVDNSIKQKRINTAVTDIKQINKNEVQAKFQDVVFDNLIGWLQQLQKREAVKIKKIILRRTETQGVVSADVVLVRAGG